MMAPEKRAIYVPAVGPQFFSYWKKNLRYKEFDFKWFTDSSFFQYRYALTSASFGIKDAWYWRDESKFDGILMADSGGYQIASYARKGKQAKIGPEASLRWQEDNCDIGFNLDVPLNNNSSFEACLKKSLENSTLFQNKRRNDTMKLYNVLHGRNLQEIETWYKSAKDFDFDGWAIGVKGDIYAQILAYLVLHEKDAPNLDNVHLFGASSLEAMLALAMLSKHFNTAITFDSTSYSRASRFRNWYFPLNIRHIARFGRNAKRSMKAIPCKCPVCSNATIADVYSQDNPTASLLIALHNLYQFIEVNQIIGIIVEDEEAFEDYAKSVGELELVQNVNDMLAKYERGGTQYVLAGESSMLKSASETRAIAIA